MIKEFCESVEEINKELCRAKKSRQYDATYKKFDEQRDKIKSFVDVDLEEIFLDGKSGKIRSYQGRVKIDQVKKETAGKLDGFWLPCTNHYEKCQNKNFSRKTEDIIDPYRDRNVIESSFRDIKSVIKIEPSNVRVTSHVRAHYTLCVLAYLINRTITLRLHENPGTTTENVFTHERLFQSLAGCMIDKFIVKCAGVTGFTMTEITQEQNELLQRLGLNYLFKPKFLTEINKG